MPRLVVPIFPWPDSRRASKYRWYGKIKWAQALMKSRPFTRIFRDSRNFASSRRGPGVHHDAVGDDAPLSRLKNARGNLMENEFFSVENNGVAGVIAALVTHNGVRLLSEEVNDFPFSFIAPLGADND
jgi:hypothetical protein